MRTRDALYHSGVTPNDHVDPGEVRLLEELALNAWPSLHTRPYDGWLLRFSNGYTRRANSVQSLHPSSLDVEEKIAECERAYGLRGQDTIFKLTPAAQPADLDVRLDALGYRREAPTSVQTMPIGNAVPPASDAVTLERDATDRWIDAFARLSATDPRHLPAMRRMLASIPTERRFAALHEGGEVVATALCVVERGYAGFLDVVTDRRMRGRGLAPRVMLHLLRWAQAEGARHAYLQVMRDNAPALRLYEKLGFREAYEYWYRVKPRDVPGAGQARSRSLRVGTQAAHAHPRSPPVRAASPNPARRRLPAEAGR